MWKSVQLLALLWIGLAPLAARAEDKLSVPAEAKFVVQVDLDKFRQTRLGGRLLDSVKRMAQQEVEQGTGGGLEQVEEALGFDPFEELHGVTIVGSSYDDPEESLRLVLQLGQTTGNLEGLLLALPGYDSSEHGGHTIHSMSDGGMHGFGAIYKDASGMHRVVAAPNRQDVIAMLDGLSGDSQGAQKEISLGVPAGTFASVQVLELPLDQLDEGEPPANVVKLLTSVSLTVSGVDDKGLAVELSLGTKEEKRAEQIQQLLQGLSAMVSLAESQIVDDQDAQKALELLKGLAIDRDGTQVSLRVDVPEEIVLKLLEEADLPL